MGTTIRRMGAGSDELRQQREDDRLADEYARDNWDDPEFQHTVQEDLVETVWLGFQHENFVEMMARVENASEFEEITLSEATGLEVFWVSQGGQIDQSQIEEHVWLLPRSFVGFHVSEFEGKIRSGFSKYMRQLAGLATTQMDAAINSRLLRTIQAAIQPGDDEYLTDATFSRATLDAALMDVDDTSSGWPGTESTQVSIIGRGPAITQLVNSLAEDNNFAPETQQAIVDLGLLGRYRGANIIKLRNWQDRNRVSYFPRDEIIVTSTAASLVGFWDGDVSKQWTEEGGFYFHELGLRTVGFAVPHKEFARRYVIGNL